MRRKISFCIVLMILSVCAARGAADEIWRPVINDAPGEFREIGRFGPARLDFISTPQGDYRILYLHGTHREMGEQYGALLGADIAESMKIYKSMASDVIDLNESTLNFFVTRTWKQMKPFTPEKYVDEIKAIVKGAAGKGISVKEDLVLAPILVSNVSDGYDIQKLLGFKVGSRPEERATRNSCSFFAAWGPRTQGGKLFASRDLDWNRDTGLTRNRLITVYDPVDEKGQHFRAYATVGYVGMIGAIAGMNDAGIAVSEIGALNVSETLHGIPWTLLARDVLENSDSIGQATAIFKGAKNTLGYNFMVADGDAENFGTPAWKPSAAAIETSSTATAVFYADDPAEKDAVAVDSQGNPIMKDNAPIRYGLPLPYAIYRGDTALSPEIRRTQVADNGPGSPGSDGMPFAGSYIDRYKFQYDMISGYETGAEVKTPQGGGVVLPQGTKSLIGAGQAAIIAAETADAGSDIMSVVYGATDLDFRVAFESGTKDTWRSAPKGGYVRFNLAELLDRYRNSK